MGVIPASKLAFDFGVAIQPNDFGAAAGGPHF
jgi:hypothetical protein